MENTKRRVTRKKTAEARFWEKVEKTDGCWNWTGTKSRGYGGFLFDGRQIGAHRFSLLLAGREIPRGLEVDHLCRNRGCVNPDHLDIVTRLENNRRRPYSSNIRDRPHCLHGHWYTDNSQYRAKTKHGGTSRQCLICALKARIVSIQKRLDLLMEEQRGFEGRQPGGDAAADRP